MLIDAGKRLARVVGKRRSSHEGDTANRVAEDAHTLKNSAISKTYRVLELPPAYCTSSGSNNPRDLTPDPTAPPFCMHVR